MLPKPTGELWIFAYGSLIWNPDFHYQESHLARLDGYHRALCIRSIHYRGNEHVPGLVMGLDAGGHCDGVAYRVAVEHEDSALDYLFEREMLNNVYVPTIVPVTLTDSNSATVVHCLTFISNTSSHHYMPDLSENDIISIVNTARGSRGTNIEYVSNTIHKLEEMEIDDPLRSLLPRLTTTHTA